MCYVTIPPRSFLQLHRTAAEVDPLYGRNGVKNEFFFLDHIMAGRLVKLSKISMHHASYLILVPCH